jgi:thiol-disulfide isomerase/thioredoxin
MAMMALGMLLAAGPAMAATQLGDAAPALAISKWVKGDAITLKEADEKDKVTVVEFWATWCGPCRVTIPHLTELQEKYKDDVVFIGVSAEEADVVASFVEKQGEKMAYRVAVDDERKTSKAYMEAFNVSGIPHAFIVDKAGHIVFSSHPMDEGFESTLQAVIADEFDLTAVKAKAEREGKINEALQAYEKVITGAEPVESAGKHEDALYALLKDDAERLAWLAYVLCEAPELAHRNLEFAAKMGKRAVELTEDKDADVLDSYATVLFNQGKAAEAIAVEKKALELVGDNAELREHIEQQIARFEAGATAES